MSYITGVGVGGPDPYIFTEKTRVGVDPDAVLDLELTIEKEPGFGSNLI